MLRLVPDARVPGPIPHAGDTSGGEALVRPPGCSGLVPLSKRGRENQDWPCLCSAFTA